MKLFLHELHKIYSCKINWILCAIFLPLILFSNNEFFFHTDNGYGDMNDFYRSTYLGKEGPVTSEMLAAAVEGRKLLPNDSKNMSLEEIRLDTFYYDTSDVTFHRDKWTAYMNDLEEAVQTALRESGENSYAYRDAALHLQMARNVPEPGLYFIYSWKDVIDEPGYSGFLITALLILIGLSPVFWDLWGMDMDAPTLSSREKKILPHVKIASGAVYCITTNLLISLVILGFSFLWRGYGGWNSPLQSCDIYFYSPYSLTLVQYYVVETLISMFGSVCFGLLVMLVSSLSQNPAVPFLTCGFLYGLETLAVADLHSDLAHFPWLAAFSYAELMRVKELTIQYKSYSVFGYPVPYLTLALIVFTLISAAAVWLTLFSYRKRHGKSA